MIFLNVRTYGHDSLGLKRLRRETKKLPNSNERIAKNAKNLHFWAFWAKKDNFGSFCKNGQNRIFSKKRLEQFCHAYKP